MEEWQAYFILNLINGVGPVTVARLVKKLGSARAILDASLETLLKVDNINQKVAKQIFHRHTFVNWEEELHHCKMANISITTPADSTYPKLLRNIYDPPLCLYVKGNIHCLNNTNTIAFVGSRLTSFYGINVTEIFARSAVSCNWTVVSGLARGIDTAAHKTVVENNGCTIAVIGSGLAHLYPQENLALARNICENGAIISEFPLNFPPERRSFPIRNRLISGLSLATLVIEGSIKSGSIITAMQAIEQGRPVFAVPGLITNPNCSGCHKLIKQGACLTESFFDIINELNDQQLELNFNENADNYKSSVKLPLNELEKKIVSTMEKRADAMTADEISELSEIAIGQILSTLMVLEMKQVVKQLPGMFYILKNY